MANTRSDRRVDDLLRQIESERTFIAKMEQELHDFVPLDPRRYRTHYDYTNFMDTSKDDLRRIIARAKSKIEYLEHRIREISREDDDLVY